jgi:hypothetical protein
MVRHSNYLLINIDLCINQKEKVRPRDKERKEKENNYLEGGKNNG